MTEKQKAEAYVRSKLPELMELSDGCFIMIGIEKQMILSEWVRKKGVINVGGQDEQPTYYSAKDYEIIGHQPQLQHWLRVLSLKDILNIDGLSMFASNFVVTTDGIAMNDNGMHLMKFDLTTGQPATEEDYQKFNEIVGI